MGCSQSKAVERVEPSPKFEEPLKIEQVIQEAATSGLGAFLLFSFERILRTSYAVSLLV